MRKVLALLVALCLLGAGVPAVAETGTTLETSYHSFQLPYQGLLVLQDYTRDDGSQIITFMKGSCVVSICSIHLGSYLDYGKIESVDLLGMHNMYLKTDGAHHAWIAPPEVFTWPSGTADPRQLVYSGLSAEDVMMTPSIAVVTEFEGNVAYTISVSFTPGDEQVYTLLSDLLNGVSVKADADEAAQQNAPNLVYRIFVTITGDTAFIRSEPSLVGPILATAVKGEKYKYDGEEGNFYVLNMDGVTAYVSKGVSTIE